MGKVSVGGFLDHFISFHGSRTLGYGEPELDGEPSSRDVGFNLGTEPGTLQDIARRCVQAFPVLAGMRIQRSWAALRVMTPDGFPVYQQSDSHPGAFSFACHSGVTLAANHALTVTDWILDGRIPEAWDAFHPERFHVQANQATA